MAGLYRVSARWIDGEIEIALNEPTADNSSGRAARERKVRASGSSGVVKKWDGGSFNKLVEKLRERRSFERVRRGR